MTASLPTGAPLIGPTLQASVLAESDVDELVPIVSDPRVYGQGYVMHRRPTDDADARALIHERFLLTDATADGRGFGRTSYVFRLRADGPLGVAGTVVGTSALMDAHLTNQSVHLGSTLYGPQWWGTTVNPEAKLLLMAHAFEVCGFGRVKIQTDRLNTRSQAAIAKLGAVREGVIRRDMAREDGSFRDSVVFSVLVDEWPAIRAGLSARLAASGEGR